MPLSVTRSGTWVGGNCRFDQLGRAMDRPRGWRRRVAEQLGIDETTLSKIVAGKRVVGWELAERAVERLKLPDDYFLPRDTEIQVPEPARKSHWRRRVPSATLIERLEAGTANVKDVFALAKAIAEDPGNSRITRAQGGKCSLRSMSPRCSEFI